MAKTEIVDLNEYQGPHIAGFNPGHFSWHILAEGDSWFHFNRVGPQENLLQHLSFEKDTAVVNVAMSGDTVQDIIAGKRYRFFEKALAEYKWHLILLSAGGNDLIDAFCGDYIVNGKRIQILKDTKDSRDFMDYIDENALADLLKAVTEGYEKIIQLRNTLGKGKNKETKILTHCYDYFTMRNNPESDSRRYRMLNRFDIAPKLWPSISDYLVDALAKTLLSLASPQNEFYVVDTRATLVRADSLTIGNSNDWRNEIHPNHIGYAKIAKQHVNNKIKSLMA